MSQPAADSLKWPIEAGAEKIKNSPRDKIKMVRKSHPRCLLQILPKEKRGAFSKKLARIMCLVANQKRTRERLTHTRDEKAIRKVIRQEIIKVLRDHMDKVEAEVAFHNELQQTIEECQDNIKRLEGKVRELQEAEVEYMLKDDQEPWEVPIPPDHMMDAIPY